METDGFGAAGFSTWQSRRRGSRCLGFTLIELLVVISLITVLAAIALSNYRNAITRSREAVLMENLFRMRDALDQYYADTGRYPPDLEALAGDGYLRQVPEDPTTRSPDTLMTIQAEPDPNDPLAETGVFDVRSGSDAAALDGSLYADW